MKSGILFVHKTGFFGELVSLFTGHYNHVAIYHDGVVDEIINFPDKTTKSCLVRYPLWWYLQNNPDHVIHELAFELEKVDLVFNLYEHVKYDWLRVILWPFRKLFNYNDKKALSCVEHLEIVLTYHNYKVPGINLSPNELFEQRKEISK